MTDTDPLFRMSSRRAAMPCVLPWVQMSRKWPLHPLLELSTWPGPWSITSTRKPGVIRGTSHAPVLPSDLHTPPTPHFLLTHPQPQSDSVCQNIRKEEGEEVLLTAWGMRCDHPWVSIQGQTTKSACLLSHIPDLRDVKVVYVFMSVWVCVCVCACMRACTHFSSLCLRQCVKPWKGIYVLRKWEEKLEPETKITPEWMYMKGRWPFRGWGFQSSLFTLLWLGELLCGSTGICGERSRKQLVYVLL